MNAPLSLAEPHAARFTVDEFLALEAAGVLDRYAKTELLDGEIIVLNAQYSEHFTTKTRLLRRLADACDRQGNGLEAWSEGTIAIPPDNLPEPDVFVTRVTPVAGLVDPATVALVIEVASTTLDRDLGQKARLYATAAIPEYWVVDVTGRVIHCMWSPVGNAYGKVRQVAYGETLASATIARMQIDTAGL